MSEQKQPLADLSVDQDLEEQRFRAYVGPRADYYLRKWRSLEGNGERRAGINWAAFFLTGLWLPYRKMYRAAVIFFGAILVESVAEEVLFVGILGRPETPAMLSRIVSFAAAGVCGTFGNLWYLSHTRGVISEVGVQPLEQPAVLEALARRGGTSLAAALCFFLGFLVVLFPVLFALQFLLYPR